MDYLEFLKLASPEAVVVVTALVVLALGLASGRATGVCSAVAAAGILFATAAVLLLPEQATLFHGMLVISPLTSLFKIICLMLAFFTGILARGETYPDIAENILPCSCSPRLDSCFLLAAKSSS